MIMEYNEEMKGEENVSICFIRGPNWLNYATSENQLAPDVENIPEVEMASVENVKYTAGDNEVVFKVPQKEVAVISELTVRV